MKNGKCPSCGSESVYNREGGVGYDRSLPFYIYVRIGGKMPDICKVNSYICTSCGYFENHIPSEDNVLKEVSEDPEWKKI